MGSFQQQHAVPQFHSASSRSAHAVDQLHVLFCISILKVLAASNADLGAVNQDNLAWRRSPSLHNALSHLLARVHTFGFSEFPSFVWFVASIQVFTSRVTYGAVDSIPQTSGVEREKNRPQFLRQVIESGDCQR
jgi:hypothetical protein